MDEFSSEIPRERDSNANKFSFSWLISWRLFTTLNFAAIRPFRVCSRATLTLIPKLHTHEAAAKAGDSANVRWEFHVNILIPL